MGVNDTRWRVPSILLIPLILCLGLLFFVDVFQFQYYTITPVKFHTEDHPSGKLYTDKDYNGFSIKTPGCRIPYLDPFDKHVKKFIKNPQVPKCNSGIPALFESNLTTLYLVNASLTQYNISDPSELRCCFSKVERVNPKKGSADNNIVIGKKCVNFNSTTDISEEFIRVTCTYEEATVYRDFFSFVPLKTNKTKQDLLESSLNVLIIGLDAVSRVNLHRQMPKTVKFFQKVNAVELLGYNKVGDNTFPNIIPVLTGMSEGELKNSCWPHSGDYFDNCSFIWKDYKKRGYTTSFGEDASWMGIFNYMRNGFMKQPTDYAYGYFSKISESKIGNSHNMNVNECVGAREVYKSLLDYIGKFAQTMHEKQIRYFGFFWGASLSHDYLNKPKLGDDYYSNFFQRLYSEGYLKRTVLIFMSDHGIRWGGIRQTYQGRMEERLPFVITVLPDWFKSQFPKAYRNLQKNERRLTTPYDLHETINDLLYPYNLTEDKLRYDYGARGQSFFREMPINRTCEAAGIDSHWCTCQQDTEIDKNASIAVETASFTVTYINSKLEGYAHCATLVLAEILNARLMSHNDDISKGDNNNSQDYMLTFRTAPGDGVFESTVRVDKSTKSLKVMGTISRLNLYGKQSACITDFHLKLYCYCTNILS